MVEVTEIIVHKGDKPDFLAHLFDTHLLPREHSTEIDFLPIEADTPACGHRDSLVVERIIKLGQTSVGPH